MKSLPAAIPPVTVGVDTHLDQHVAAVVDRPDRSTRRRRGKSDPIDAHTAARATLAGVAATTPRPATAKWR